MKTVDLSARPMSATELMEMAREESLLVKSAEGDSFIISQADEFSTEVELLRRNHSVLAMLDRFKEDENTIPLEAAEERLR